MLDALKRKTSGFTARIVLLLLAGLVGLWGIITAGGSFFASNQNAVVTVGSQTVTAAQFDVAYRQALQQVNYFDGYTTPQQAEERYQLTSVVVSRLMLQAMVADQAQKMGLGVSNEAMAAQIRLDPNFADSTGAFNLVNYRTMISQQYGTEANYLDTIRRPAELQTQIEVAIAPQQMELPNAYRQALWEYDNEQRDLLLALITPANLGLLPEPTEEEITTKYNDTAETAYQAPETRTVVVLQVNPTTQAEPEAITDEEVRAAYTERQAGLGSVETRHVFIQVLAADRAAAVQAMLDAGQTYDQLVAAAEIAPADQGTITETYFAANPAIGTAAFALEAGGTTIVEGRFGRTLVHVAEVIPATIPAYEAVADQLRQTLAQERAATTIRDLRDEVEDARAGGATLLEAAARFNLTPLTLTIDAQGNDALGQPIVDLPGGTTLVNAVFQSDVGYADPPLAGAGGYVWYEVTAILPPHQRPIEEVREEVIAAWRADDVSRRMQDLASTIVNRIDAGENLTAVAASLGLTLEPVNDVTRTTTPTNTLSSNVILAAFSGPAGYVAPARTTDGEGMVVLEVIEVTVPPFDPATPATTVEADLVAAFRNDLMQGYVRDLVDEYGNITYNQVLVRQLAGLSATTP